MHIGEAEHCLSGMNARFDCSSRALSQTGNAHYGTCISSPTRNRSSTHLCNLALRHSSLELFYDAEPRFSPVTPNLKTRQIDRREWWLWGFAVVVTIALTVTIVFLTFFHSNVLDTEDYW